MYANNLSKSGAFLLISSLIKGIVTPSIVMFSNVPGAFTPLVIFMKKLYVSHRKSRVSARKESTVHIKWVLSSTGQVTWLLWSLTMLFVSENVSSLGFMWNMSSWNWRQLIATIWKQWSFIAKKAIYIFPGGSWEADGFKWFFSFSLCILSSVITILLEMEPWSQCPIK